MPRRARSVRWLLKQPLCHLSFSRITTKYGPFLAKFIFWNSYVGVPDNLRQRGNDGLWHRSPVCFSLSNAYEKDLLMGSRHAEEPHARVQE